eukprot:CAMPEP_0119016916 /NCGR_PEP_ID=MMETSP1176-20130426/14764_1 /TAXON_ID=265551 /ORGANISM="Synedropsis recta cf, Strain CCMP1620" /LENGTH=749 /DNA_ID=CAMNT_0006970477 /DNA_START=63 /DNA_END=2312 /DNA_ORIENTATION=+
MKIFHLLFLSVSLLQPADAKIRGSSRASAKTILSRDLMGGDKDGSMGGNDSSGSMGSSGSAGSMGSSSDNPASMGSGGSMGSSGGGDSGFSGSSATLGAGECEICSSNNKIRPNSITFQYTQESGTSKHQSLSTCVGRSGLFPEFANIMANGQDFQVSAGDTFTVFGGFDAWTDMLITNEGYSCKLHTSCSQPLVAGDQLGPFQILSGGDTCTGTFTGSGCSGSNCNSDRDPPTGGSSSYPNGDCEICSQDYKVRPDALTLQYRSAGKTSLYQDRATCLETSYPLSSKLKFAVDDFQVREVMAFDGMTFTIDGPFEANTVVSIDGYGECAFHTSCSQPLVAGDQIGPFVVIGGGRCPANPVDRPVDPPSGGSSNPPPAPTPVFNPPANCEICSKQNKVRPQTLYVQYFAEGRNSAYQDEDKASCRQGTYPQGTQLEFGTKGDARFFNNVQDGDMLTIEGPFEAYTNVAIAGWGSCNFHTSCSVPLVAGDRIGPFQIMGSDERCNQPVPQPNPAPVDPPSGGSADTPAPTPFPTPNPTPDPTPGPTSPPTPDPTPGPSPSPSASPSNRPSIERSEIPSPSPSERPTKVASESPSDEPSDAPTPTPCLRLDKASYECGEPIVVDFNFDNAFSDDWIGIYPCETNVYLHSEVWQWACGAPGCADAVFKGDLVFNGLPSYNANGPHTWPIAPYMTMDGPLNRCFKAVYLREDGPSVPPYNAMCESIEFTIQENNDPGCSVREANLNVIGDDEA